MEAVRVLGRSTTLTVVPMMGNGRRIKSTELDNLFILIRLDITDNGRKTQGKVMGHIITRMEISTKVTGIVICKTGLGLTITPMEISTKGSGSTAALTARATISILHNEEFIKGIGDKAEKKGLGS